MHWIRNSFPTQKLKQLVKCKEQVSCKNIKKWIKVVKIFSLEWIWIFFSFFLKNNNYISDNGKIWEQVNKSLKANFRTKVFWTTIQNKLCVKKSSRGGLVDRAVASHSVRMQSFLSAVDRIPLGPDVLLKNK